MYSTILKYSVGLGGEEIRRLGVYRYFLTRLAFRRKRKRPLDGASQ